MAEIAREGVPNQDQCNPERSNGKFARGAAEILELISLPVTIRCIDESASTPK